MVAYDVFFRAQDERNRLVGNTIAQHQNRLLFTADRARGAFFEVDGPAENLLGIVLQRSGSVDLTDRLFPPVVHHKVHVQHLLLLPQITDTGVKTRASAVQVKMPVAVHVAPAKQNLT